MSLSIDSLFLGIAYGASKTKINAPAKLIICLCSVIYASIALLVGHSFSFVFPPEISKIIGACLLAVMGIAMIIKSFKKSDDEEAHSPEKTGHKEIKK